VFSSSQDGDMTFEDFLDMMSVFSDNAPKSVKVEYAFRIYGMLLLTSIYYHKNCSLYPKQKKWGVYRNHLVCLSV